MPRATYLAIAVIGTLYVITSWILVGTNGGTNAGGGGRRRPRQLDPQRVRERARRPVGAPGQLAAAHQPARDRHRTAQHVVPLPARFGREGVLPPALARTHRVARRPSSPASSRSSLVVVVAGAYALAGADPYLNLGSQIAGVGSLGGDRADGDVLVLGAVLLPPPRRLPPVAAPVAPVLAGLALLFFAFLIVDNYALVSGSTSSRQRDAVCPGLWPRSVSSSVSGGRSRRQLDALECRRGRRGAALPSPPIRRFPRVCFRCADRDPDDSADLVRGASRPPVAGGIGRPRTPAPARGGHSAPEITTGRRPCARGGRTGWGHGAGDWSGRAPEERAARRCAPRRPARHPGRGARGRARQELGIPIATAAGFAGRPGRRGRGDRRCRPAGAGGRGPQTRAGRVERCGCRGGRRRCWRLERPGIAGGDQARQRAGGRLSGDAQAVRERGADGRALVEALVRPGLGAGAAQVVAGDAREGQPARGDAGRRSRA